MLFLKVATPPTPLFNTFFYTPKTKTEEKRTLCPLCSTILHIYISSIFINSMSMVLPPMKILFILGICLQGWAILAHSSYSCNVTSENELQIAVDNLNCPTIQIEGKIMVTTTVSITRPVSMRGVTTDAAIIQSHTLRDAIVIRDVTDGVLVEDILINASTAQAALVVANASNVAIRRIVAIGSESVFAIFFAGRDVTAGQASLDNFASRTEMDTNNSMTDSVVSSPWTGDSLSFSLQYLGTLTNNTVINGRRILFLHKKNLFLIGFL